jgi:hypothetical protein
MSALLLDVLRDPAAATRLDPAAWDLVLRQARVERLHARLAATLVDMGLLEEVVEPVRTRLRAYATMSESHDRGARWEVDRIAAALEGIDAPVVLLKGAAYLMSGLKVARGRLTDDVDILVPKERIGVVEEALLGHGWEAVKVDAYDQEYYRKWMHELPPLRHRNRHSTVDVHHTILPETSRLHPDAKELLRTAVPLPDAPRILVLKPVDMVLHGSAHLFYDGAIAGGLRDLVDLDDLLRHFAREEAFWEELLARAERLDLARPLFYTLRYASRILATPVPQGALERIAAHRPGRTALALMDRLAPAALVPAHPDRPSGGFARWLLYVRSHWLRMPPHLLAYHLTTKGVKRLFGKPT